MCLSPEPVGDGDGIDAHLQPPFLFFGGAMDLPMMHPAERHRELIADLAAECPGLCEAQMMGVGGLAAANQTGLRRDKLAVALVAQSARFGRDSVMFEIWEVCGGPVRAFCCTGCARSHLGL